MSTSYKPIAVDTQQGVVPSVSAASAHMDAMRATAALAVLLNHWRNFFFVEYRDVKPHSLFLGIVYFLSGLGHESVIVFFVLSGYLVGGSVLRQLSAGRWSWKGYLFARLTRLYPVLIPALLLGFLLDAWGVHHFGMGRVYGPHAAELLGLDVYQHLSWKVLVGNYFFLQDILVPIFGTNGPLWSLSYEFWYYIAFPFLAVVLYKRSPLRLRIISLAGFVAVLAFTGKTIDLYFVLWLMGVAIYLVPPLTLPNRSVRTAVWLAAFCAIAGTLAAEKVFREGLYYADLYIGLSISALLYIILHWTRNPLPRPYVRISQHLARSSYTLYLVHMPLLVFLAAWWGQDLAQPFKRSSFEIGIFGVFVFLYAQVVWWLFEARTEKFRSWLKPYVFTRPRSTARVAE